VAVEVGKYPLLSRGIHAIVSEMYRTSYRKAMVQLGSGFLTFVRMSTWKVRILNR